MSKTVYLAGNIEGLSYTEASDWRETATQFFKAYAYEVRDPMRDKEFLIGCTDIQSKDIKHMTSKEVFNRDIQDVRDSDIIFTYLTKLGIGTSFELGVAYQLGKKIVLVTVPELYNHPFLQEGTDYITQNLEDGLLHSLHIL